MSTIAFIGAGNMASSIIGGLLKQDFAANSIIAADPNADALGKLAQTFAITTTTDNTQAVQAADVLVLAVKPQVMAPVCKALAANIKPGALVISIAAGIECASLQNWLGGEVALVRCMPNTPALVQMGASGLFAEPAVTAAQRQLAETIMAAVGTVLWVEEEALIDAVIAVSGSGPAYFFLMLEAMAAEGTAMGLSAETAKALAIQTAAGAAKLAAESEVDLAELRRRVTSPGGTTEQAILSFERDQFRATVAKAMQACKHRAEEMAAQMGEQ